MGHHWLTLEYSFNRLEDDIFTSKTFANNVPTSASDNCLHHNGDTQRVIRHFHFTTWPDFGVPNPPTTLIRFVRAFRERISPEQRPIVVHCRFNDTVVYSEDSDTYREIIKYLNQIEADFHCYQLKEDKSYRVVIRNLHHTTPVEDIANELIGKGYNVKRVHNAKHPVSKVPLPLFFVDLSKEEKSREIFKENVLLYTRIKVEEPRQRRENVTQCFKCFQYGHTHNYCYHTPKCVKCGEEHASQTCALPPEAKPKCANCQEDHPATYRGCKIYKAIKTIRSSHTRPNLSSTTHQASSQPTQEQPRNRQYKQVTQGISFSAVANQQAAFPSLPNPIQAPQPLPSSSQTIPPQPLPQRQPRLRPTPSPPQPQPVPQIQPFDPSILFQSFLDRLEALLTPLISLLTSFMQHCLPKLLK